MEDLIRLTDLKNWAYCPRVVYYRRVMPEAASMTGKMRSGLRAQELIEKLELRRTLDRYDCAGARRAFGRWLSDEMVGLSGRLDLILIREEIGETAVVDYKLTGGDPGDDHRLQLHGYAVLVERAYGVRVDQAFLYRIPDERVFVAPIEKAGRERVLSAVDGIRSMIVEQSLPPPTLVPSQRVR